MPRNPDKTRCTIPGCQNWAMRNQARCRVHRDAELGPRGAGAPYGNLNALQNGAYTHPLLVSEFENLVTTAVRQPQNLPLQIGLALRSIQSRTGDTYLALVAFHALLSQLTDRVAAHLSSIELQNILQSFPAPVRDRLQAVLIQHLDQIDPRERLLNLRKIKKRREQLPEQGKTML